MSRLCESRHSLVDSCSYRQASGVQHSAELSSHNVCQRFRNDWQHEGSSSYDYYADSVARFGEAGSLGHVRGSWKYHQLHRSK